MNKMSLLRSSVLILVTFSGVLASANAPSCGGLFTLVGLNTALLPMPVGKVSFMNTTLQGVLRQLRTANPKVDHIPHLSQQVPLIVSRLYVQMTESTYALSNPKLQYTREELNLYRRQAHLKEQLQIQYQKIADEGFSTAQQGKVTYQWYMNFFLKALLFSDVTARVQRPESSTLTVEQLILRLKQIDSEGHTLFTANMNETAAHSALANRFASLAPDANFARHRQRLTMIPVLFNPEAQDVLRADALNARFISLTGSVRQTKDGVTYPLENAGQQILKSNEALKPVGVR